MVKEIENKKVKVDIPQRIEELKAELKDCQDKIDQYNQAIQQLVAQGNFKIGAIEELKALID